MRLLVDMNLSPSWVEFLAAAGIDAVHWSSLGSSNAPDSTILAYAASRNWAVLTHDLDFSAILAATGKEKPSVIQIRTTDLNMNTIGPIIVSAVRQMQAELQAGALVTIDPKRIRARVLPLPTHD